MSRRRRRARSGRGRHPGRPPPRPRAARFRPPRWRSASPQQHSAARTTTSRAVDRPTTTIPTAGAATSREQMRRRSVDVCSPKGIRQMYAKHRPKGQAARPARTRGSDGRRPAFPNVRHGLHQPPVRRRRAAGSAQAEADTASSTADEREDKQHAATVRDSGGAARPDKGREDRRAPVSEQPQRDEPGDRVAGAQVGGRPPRDHDARRRPRRARREAQGRKARRSTAQATHSAERPA